MVTVTVQTKDETLNVSCRYADGLFDESFLMASPENVEIGRFISQASEVVCFTVMDAVAGMTNRYDGPWRLYSVLRRSDTEYSLRYERKLVAYEQH